MPAGCGLDFEGISSPRSPAITARKAHKLVTVSLADKHRWLYKNLHGEWRKVKGSEKVPTTPIMPTARWQDLDQECPSTRDTSLESQHNSAKYIRYLKLLKGKPVTSTDLGIFSQFVGKLAALKMLWPPPFRPYQTLLTQKDTPVKSSEHLANCNFANLLPNL